MDEEPETAVTYEIGAEKSNVGAGTLPGRADWVIPPSGISHLLPRTLENEAYRTDNGTGLGQPNGAITRPWNVPNFLSFI